MDRGAWSPKESDMTEHEQATKVETRTWAHVIFFDSLMTESFT